MKIYILITALLLSFSANAGDGISRAGARASAMGGSALTNQDAWAMFYNPAGIAFIKNPSAGISVERRFSIKELSTNALVFAMPAGKDGTIGINGSYFGYKNYNDQQAGVAYGRRFGEKVSAGIKINYQSIHIGEEFGDKSFVTAEAGLQAMIVRNLWIAGYIYNPSRTKIVDEPKELLGSIISFGAGYIFSDKFILSLSAEKNSDYKGRFHSGFEYKPVHELALRAGISSQPFESSFGFGLLLGNLEADFAAGFHQQLGFTPHISLGYQFARK